MLNRLAIVKKHPEIFRYVFNSSWMLSEYVLKFIAAFFVTIYVARYLGPEKFGVLSYVLAILGVFMAVTRLGMDSILVRELSKNYQRTQALMGTAHALMLLASVIGLIIMGGVVYTFEDDAMLRVYVWYVSVALVFQTFLVIDYNFQAQLKVRYATIAKFIALALSSLIKIVLVWMSADLSAFVIAYAFDHALIMMMLLVAHFNNRQAKFIFGFDSTLVKPLLRSAWPLILSAAAVVLYMRIDQVMIKNMLGAHQLGLYSAAVKIYESWIMIPYVLSMSLLPAIVKFKSVSVEDYEDKLSRLFALVFWTSVLVAVISTLAGKWIILLAFGEAYEGASPVLTIVMWTSAFAALGFVSARYLTVERLENKILIRTLAALLVNILLNFVLIPIIGIVGAAISTLVSIILANYILDYFDADLKKQLMMKNKALIGIFYKKEIA